VASLTDDLLAGSEWISQALGPSGYVAGYLVIDARPVG
jgi:hypothetical protein